MVFNCQPHFFLLENKLFNTNTKMLPSFQLEIMHGVLNDVNLHKERSFFYLRNKAEELGLPEDQLKVTILSVLREAF